MNTQLNNIPPFPNKPSYLFLTGLAGKLELLITPIQTSTAIHSPTIAIICHPDPRHGGTMHNKVVYTTTKALQRLNIHTIQFNYRGVGKSEGTYGAGDGEALDLLTIIKWLKQIFPKFHLWLAGFSFGSYVAIKVAAQHGCEQLITIAPAITLHDYDQYMPLTTPWLLIQGEQDEIISADAVIKWALQLTRPPKIITFPEAGHFFHGQLMNLRDQIINNLKRPNYE